jgi:hypothetical protein
VRRFPLTVQPGPPARLTGERKLWSLLVIALDVVVIWALTAHGREVTT